MEEKRSFFLLITIMGIVALIAMAMTNIILYQVAFKETSQSLIETAQSQARLIEAMARYNKRTNRVDWEVPVGERGPTSLLSERAAADTLSQLRDAHKNYNGFGETGEFVLAGIENEQIVFLLNHRNDAHDEPPEPIPLYSDLAEPMRRALLVQSGVMVAKDYRGVEVLAAYEPVDVLNFGIVAKVDMSEIRAPFIKGAIYTSIIAFIVILAGAYIFRRVTDPIVEKIRQSELQYRSLVEDIAEWVWETDSNGIIKFSNSIVEKILGFRHQEVFRQPITNYLENSADFAVAQLINYDDEEKRVISDAQTTAMTKSGNRIHIEISASPVYDAENNFLGYRGVARDITTRIQAEQLRAEYQETLEKQVKDRTQELNDINEELQSFTYIVSHDLRSPLVSIVGFSSELKEDIAVLSETLGDNEKIDDAAKSILHTTVPEALQFIDKAAEKMEGLIDSVLALSRLGRRELSFTNVNTAELVDLNIKALGYQLENVTVNVGELPEIYSDETALTQIFGNLLGNAAKYLRPEVKGEITISCEEIKDDWKFSISDNGCGIAENDLPHIFELFKRVGNQQVKGDGMGLTYVQTLIRRLGGRISCESKLGEGSTFTFFLPKHEKN